MLFSVSALVAWGTAAAFGFALTATFALCALLHRLSTTAEQVGIADRSLLVVVMQCALAQGYTFIALDDGGEWLRYMMYAFAQMLWFSVYCSLVRSTRVTRRVTTVVSLFAYTLLAYATVVPDGATRLVALTFAAAAMNALWALVYTGTWRLDEQTLATRAVLVATPALCAVHYACWVLGRANLALMPHWAETAALAAADLGLYAVGPCVMVASRWFNTRHDERADKDRIWESARITPYNSRRNMLSASTEGLSVRNDV